MNKFITTLTLALVAQAGLIGAVRAEPVVYRLTTVSDGRLGSLNFTEAVVTITFRGDTRGVRLTIENGSPVYYNRHGVASVSVTQNGRTTTARFAPGQIYTRYDVYNGVVGFGSAAISPTYPIVVGCGFESCGADASGTPWGYSIADYGTIADLGSLPSPSDLTHSTLFTGTTSACAAPYEVGACPVAAPAALSTDAGDFYLQDIYWNLWYSDYANYDSNCNWDERSVCGGNVGYFSVEVQTED